VAYSTRASAGALCWRCGKPAGTRIHVVDAQVQRDACLVCAVVLAGRWRELGGGQVEVRFHPGVADSSA
jgi:hypothetical protein